MTKRVYIYGKKMKGEGAPPCEICNTDVNLLSICWSCQEEERHGLKDLKQQLRAARDRERVRISEVADLKVQLKQARDKSREQVEVHMNRIRDLEKDLEVSKKEVEEYVEEFGKRGDKKGKPKDAKGLHNYLMSQVPTHPPPN